MSTAAPSPPVVTADVAVIGFGPTGLVLASLLARRGVDVVAVDAATDIYPLPRAAHVDHEAMRVLQELGCAEELATGLRPNPGMDVLTASHEVLLSMSSTSRSVLGWPPSSFIHQPSFEAVMRTHALAGGARVLLGHEVVALEQDAHDVLLSTHHGVRVSARWVVAADGARSWTRKALGLPLHDLGFEEPWLVVDLLLHQPVAGLPDRCLQVCDPARPHTLVPMPGNRFRFEFMLLPGEAPAEMQDPLVVARLAEPWLPAHAFTVERSAVYTFHGLIAQRWQEGRVLLAGDAAHQMPPFLGQGMCSGIRDAANLAWKLQAVLGGAPPALLATCQAEREPHVRSIVEAAVGFGRVICTLDPDAAAERDTAMLAARAAHGDAPPNDGAPMPPLAGALVLPGGGRPAPQPVVGGRLLDDVVGTGWLVAARSPDLLETPDAAWWRHRGAVLLHLGQHPGLAAVLDAVGADVVVVRPDRIVLGGAASVADLTAPVRHLLEAASA